ncbi:MAG: dihydrofolate reductase family protein [Sphingomonadales bacterium]|nr:dihydrofolate reductase family protein [Sphingomonadales bacterium]
MRKLILKMAVSLDGFVSGPNGEADWIGRTGGDDALEWLVDNLWQAGLHAVGSRSYRAMAAFYPTSTLAFAPPMNDIPKMVFTRKGLDASRDATAAPADGSWANPFVASGDLRDEVTRLKAQPGKDIMAHGGANFAQELVAHGLVDEYRLMVHPVALGKGLPLFSQLPEPLDLHLVSSRTFRSGAMAQVYRPA